MRISTGNYQKTIANGESVHAFVPQNLHSLLPLQVNSIQNLLDKANIAIGRLDGISITLPNLSLFLYMYIRKEAVLSSQIEGTQSTLSDFLRHEAEQKSMLNEDIAEVSNYVDAMNHGLLRINNDFPLSLRLIREMHAKLLHKGRGSNKQPGVFRKTQNWIGARKPSMAIHVPPPPNLVDDLMKDLEKFWHEEPTKIPTLLKAALAHVQFETIHPFLDGNGRLGRLLITFILCVDGIMKKPLLYLSLYFKQNRSEYYERLQQVREKGDLNKWFEFFLNGVIETSEQAVSTIQEILHLFKEDQEKISKEIKLTSSLMQVYYYLQKFPITDIKSICEHCEKLTFPTASKAMSILEQANIVHESTGKLRGKIYTYTKYLDLLSRGTELD